LIRQDDFVEVGYVGRRWLVTGGAGFIGSAFVRNHLRDYPDDTIVVLDKLTYAGNLANLAPIADRPNYQFVHGDIGDAERVGELMPGVDVVINFAAETHVDRSILDPGAFIETDVRGTWVLLEAARWADVSASCRSVPTRSTAKCRWAPRARTTRCSPAAPTRRPRPAAS